MEPNCGIRSDTSKVRSTSSHSLTLQLFMWGLFPFYQSGFWKNWIYLWLQVRCCLCRKFGWSWTISPSILRFWGAYTHFSQSTWLWLWLRITVLQPMPVIFVLVTQSKFTGVPVTDILWHNQKHWVHKWKNKTLQIWTPASWQSGETPSEGWITEHFKGRKIARPLDVCPISLPGVFCTSGERLQSWTTLWPSCFPCCSFWAWLQLILCQPK